MTSVELKEQLISRIQITDDPSILEFVLGILEQSDKNDIYEFNNEQKKRIDIALKQIEKGEIYTEEEADKITKEWLRK